MCLEPHHSGDLHPALAIVRNLFPGDSRLQLSTANRWVGQGRVEGPLLQHETAPACSGSVSCNWPLTSLPGCPLLPPVVSLCLPTATPAALPVLLIHMPRKPKHWVIRIVQNKSKWLGTGTCQRRRYRGEREKDTDGLQGSNPQPEYVP